MSDDTNNLKVDLEVLKKEYSQLNVLLVRLDTTIEKLSEVSSGISRMLAVHENRLEQQEDVTKSLFVVLENRRKEQQDAFDKIKAEFQTEIVSVEKKIEALEKKIEENEKSINSIERWKYWLIGAALAIGFLISQFQFFDRFFN